nr:MAG TPA: hypothetical protein [Caudoviricetes sp.]DAY47866.1 MAG TPA: hypothetical protein [Caudoviricetes sp.]
MTRSTIWLLILPLFLTGRPLKFSAWILAR